MKVFKSIWSNHSSCFLSDSDIYIESSFFEHFSVSDSSACILLLSKHSIEIRVSTFSDIVNLVDAIETGAAVYTDYVTLELIFDKLCFVDCESYHGHCFGCYGVASASLNSTAMLTRVSRPRGHPSFIVREEAIYSDGTNLSNSIKESIYLRSNQLGHINHYSITNISVGSVYPYALYSEDLRADNLIICDICDANAAILGYDSGTIKNLYIKNLEDAVLCKGKITISNLFYESFNPESMLGNARVVKKVSMSIEIPYIFDIDGCSYIISANEYCRSSILKIIYLGVVHISISVKEPGHVSAK